VPAWVLPVPEADAADATPSGGVALLVLDDQTRAVGHDVWRFKRRVARMTSEAGLRAWGELKLEFVPPAQRLVVHTIRLRRGSELISKLELAKIQVLQREQGLEAEGVYDGTRTALSVLSDLRVGDTVELEYSIVGANPVLGGRWTELWPVHQSVEVGFSRHRLLADRPFAVALLGTDVVPRGSTLGTLRDYEVVSSPAPPVVLEPETPTDLTPARVGLIELSDAGTWQDVAAWGSALFALPAKLPPAVVAFADRFRDDAAPPRDVAAAVVQAVQREVRYLSLALNEGTHRPAQPDVVLARHFGDCKDKTLLAVALLRSLGFDASPALVSTSLEGALGALVPAPTLFDHAIVRLRLQGADYYLDPTRTFQRGTLGELAVHEHRFALVLEPGTQGLSTVAPRKDARPDVTASVTVKVGAAGEPVTLEATTTYRHEIAVALRTLHAEGQPSDFQKEVGRVVTAAYPSARRLDEASFADEPAMNEATVSQSFEIPDAWEKEDGKQKLVVQAAWDRFALDPLPAERQSTFALGYPLHIAHEIRVIMRTPLKVTAAHESKEVWPFHFVKDVKQNTDGVLLGYDLRTLADRVEPARFDAYRKATNELYLEASYGIAIRPRVTVPPKGPTWLFVVTALWAVLLAGAMVLVLRYKPYLRQASVPFDPARAGLGGWLALVSISVFLTPIGAAFLIAKGAFLLGASNWATLTNPESSAYNAYWAPFLAGTLLFRVFLVVVGSVLASLFLRRHRSFPWLFVVLASGIALVSVIKIVTSPFAPATEKTEDSVQGIVYCVLWSAYMLRSRRVKATFLGRELAAPASEEEVRAGWVERW